MARLKHTNEGDICPLCEQKLMSAHDDLAHWFRERVKPKFKDAHVSCAWRNKFDQNQAHAEGKSQLPWPKSAHNKYDDQGNPCSLAIDLFELCSNGMARWSFGYFRQIAEHSKMYGDPVEWGGDWTKFKDAPHFELIIKKEDKTK